MTTSRREKALLVATIVMVFLAPVYLWLRQMWASWHEFDSEALRMTQKLNGARELIRRRGEFEKKWRSISGRVERAKEEGADARFRAHLWALAENEADLHFDELRPRRQEEEDRIVVTFSADFKCQLDKLVRFLYALDRADDRCAACLLEQKERAAKGGRRSRRARNVKADKKAAGDPSPPDDAKDDGPPLQQPRHTCQLLKVTSLSVRTTSKSDRLSVNMDIATLTPIEKKGRSKRVPGRPKRGRS